MQIAFRILSSIARYFQVGVTMAPGSVPNTSRRRVRQAPGRHSHRPRRPPNQGVLWAMGLSKVSKPPHSFKFARAHVECT
eukprot:3353303-Rhodomonas_salina.2